MVFAESLGREVKDYIKNLLDRDADVLDVNGNILNSDPQNGFLGSIVLPKDSTQLSSCKNVEVAGSQKVLIPLRHQSQNIAFLLVDDTEDLKNYVMLIKSFAELLIQQHHENNKPALDATDQFIIKILNSYNKNEDMLLEAEAKILGYDLSIRRVGIVLHLDGFWENCLLDLDQPSFERDQVIKTFKRNIERAFNSFFTKNSDLIIAYAGNDKFAIFKAVDKNDDDSVKKLLKKSFKSIFEPLKNHRINSVTVGYSNAYDSISGLISAKREADLALELGQRIWGSNQSYFFGDLGLLSILGEGDREKKLVFAEQTLNKLKNDDLNKTLECFFENNLNLTETALQMGIHRNTVIYRLNQITKVLNADPRVFEQAMTIKIALLINHLFGQKITATSN